MADQAFRLAAVGGSVHAGALAFVFLAFSVRFCGSTVAPCPAEFCPGLEEPRAPATSGDAALPLTFVTRSLFLPMSGTPDIESWLRIGRHRWSPIPQKAGGDFSLLIAIGAPLEGTLGDRGLGLCGPRSALFLPDRTCRQASLRDFDGLWLRLEADRLTRAAAQVSGHTWSPRRFAPLLQEPVCLDGAEGPGQRHLERLEVVARLLDPSASHPPEETEPLALRDVLDRLVVLALWGDRLQRSCRQAGSPGCEREAILEDLLAWIRANSNRPLHLAELEQRSGYSDRSLRNAFQARFGCPPKQWIRQTRMESARQRLLDPRPGDSVSTIARDHGYQHVSQFSRDFRCVYGERPSLLMRQARRAVS